MGLSATLGFRILHRSKGQRWWVWTRVPGGRSVSIKRVCVSLRWEGADG